MTLMIAGLVLFLGMHLVPVVPPLRARWVAASGETGYRRVFSLVSAAGLALIVAGYMAAPRGTQLFAGYGAAQAAAPLVMIASFVLFAAANMRTHIRARLRHPMLLGLILWSGVHLLANGDLRGTVLFGAFLGYGIVDLVSATGRGAVKPFVPTHKQDVMAILGGVIVAFVVMLAHRLLFGVPAVWWSL